MLGKLGGVGCASAVVALIALAPSAGPQPSRHAAQPVSAAGSWTLPGELRAWHEAPVYSRVNGYVKRWYFDYGAAVKTGQVLADIEAPDLDAGLDAAMARLEAAKADADLRQAELQFAESTYRRWREAPQGVVSVQETAGKKADFEVAAARVEAATAGLRAARRQVDRLRAQSGLRRIMVPFDGIVTERNTDVGAPVNADCASPERGAPVLFRVADVRRMRIFVKVPEQTSAGMEPGLKAALRSPRLPGKVFEAVVATTSREIDVSSRTLLVELNADNPDGALVPGGSIEVQFKLPGSPGT
jgi:RND family efflux transporter MFP subunit